MLKAKRINATTQTPYLVLYDPNCKFCRRSVRVLKKLDEEKRTEAVPLSDLTRPVLSELSSSEVRNTLHIVTPANDVIVGFNAVLILASLFPLTRLLASIGTSLPFFVIGTVMYNLIANNRYLFGRCENDHCDLR